MRFIGSLIKYLVYLCIILVALSAALFWFDTGSWLVKPLAERAGNFFLAPMRLEIQTLDGSLRNGYSLSGLTITSGDDSLLNLEHASVTPNWNLVLSGLDGLPFISSVNVQGLTAAYENFRVRLEDFHGTEPSGGEIAYVRAANAYEKTGYYVRGLNVMSGDEELLNLESAYVNPDWPSVANGLDGLPFIRELNVGKVTGGLDSLRFRLNGIHGSEPNGYIIDGLSLSSNDSNVLSIAAASVSPDWPSIMKGNDGIPYVKSLRVRTVRSDLDRVLEVVDYFTTSEDEEAGTESEDEEPFTLTRINPLNVDIRDVIFTTPYANVSLDKITLNEAGKLLSYAKIISRDKVMPIRTEAYLNYDPLEILSSDLSIGKGKGSVSARLEPLRARIDLTALSLEELLRFAPPTGIKASGRIDSRLFVETKDDVMSASGVVSMPRANVMDIPLSFRLPFQWDGGKILTVNDARLNTNVASVNLNARTDIESMTLKAKGDARNISLYEIGRMFAPEAGLKGEGGNLRFDVDAILSGDILGRTRANMNANIPLISAAGLRILKDLNAHINLTPKEAPRISMSGEVFGGKLFARGEALQSRNGDIMPEAVISIVNLDMNTLIKAFPDLAKSISKPSGKVTVNTRVASDLSVTGKVTSDKLSANGITLTKLLANLKYDHQRSRASLESFTANLGRAALKASAHANLNDSSFTFNGNADNFDPRAIPELKDLSGSYNVRAEASGRYTRPDSIKANVNLTGRNMGYAGMRLGNLNVPLSYASDTLRISYATATLPGGTVGLNGTVNLKNASNPRLDLAASTQGINLAELMNGLKLQDKSMPVSGRVRGSVNVSGPLNTASVGASLYASNVKAGDLVNMPTATIEASGNMNRVNVKKFSAKLNGADINGGGNMSINQKNIMKSSLNVNASVKNLELKPLLIAAMGDAPAEGTINGTMNLGGTLAQPQLDVKLTSPIYASGQKIEDIFAKMSSPAEDHYKINAGARIGRFKPEADVDLQNKSGIWTYRVDTKPLDINRAIESQMPDMKGMARGFARVSVQGNTKPDSNIDVKVTASDIDVMDKIKIQRVVMPLVYMQAKNALKLKNGTVRLYDGTVTSNLDVDLNKKTWVGKVNASQLDFGKLATPFMPEGELVGKVNGEIDAKGNFGVMPTNFANGRFETTPGYIHKMEMLKTITPTEKISFEKINGTFFWDGNDLFLNPGTGARAGKDEPLYRYFTINGSAGIPGKGLKLLCDGRFDLKMLDQLLGAMKGVFQYMTGGLTRNVLKDAAGRALGLKGRDFQNVSFTLANSWENLSIENLKVTKPIEEFLPINVLNNDEEKQKSEAKFSIRLKIPTGPGEDSVEDESTTDQFKQQLIDNLFNLGL